MLFKYIVINEKGEKKNGSIDATNRDLAINALQRRGLTIISIVGEEEKKHWSQLIIFERNLGIYSIAGAICSYGDAIDFIDGERQGIIIADTCGHVKEFGDEVKKYIPDSVKIVDIRV